MRMNYNRLGLKHIYEIQFDDVMDRWMDDEKDVEWWKELAIEKGFSSVREWRMSYFDILNFNPRNFKWNNVGVTDFDLFFENLFVGPFRPWRQFFQDRDKSRFIDMKIDLNAKMQDICDNFPSETTLVGFTDGMRISLLEGNHRSAALSKKFLNGSDINQYKVSMNLLDLSEDVELFEKIFYYWENNQTK